MNMFYPGNRGAMCARDAPHAHGHVHVPRRRTPIRLHARRCYAAATGEERWRLDLPISGDLASADIDGDGIREFIAGGSALYAIKGDREAGRVAWSLEFDHPTSSPVVADLDGDGQSEILVVTADGYLCAIGDAGQMDCAGTRRH